MEPLQPIMMWSKGWSCSHSISNNRTYITKRVYDTGTSTSYPSRTGQVVEVLRNADKDDDGFPAGDYPGTPPTDRNDDGGSLLTIYMRDVLGRVQERVTPGDVSTFTLREMRTFPGRSDIKYYAVITLPHEFGGPTEYNGPGTITWYNGDDDVIGTSDYEIESESEYTYAAAPSSQTGYTQVITDYDLDGDEDMENDQLARAEIAHDVSGYKQLSPEIVVERDPELIIAQYSDNISGNDAFKDVKAVKGGYVLVPQSNALSVAGPRFVEGIEEIAKWAYPDLFE